MEQLYNLTHAEIERSIPDEQVRISRMISLALITGPLIFLIMIIALFKNDLLADIPRVQSDQITTITYSFLIFLILAVASFYIFPRLLLRSQSIRKQTTSNLSQIENHTSNTGIMVLIFLDRTNMLVRLGFMEIASLGGMLMLFAATMHNDTNIIPLTSLWYLLLPWVFQTIYTFTHYVSKEKMVNRIENTFLPALRKAAETV